MTDAIEFNSEELYGSNKVTEVKAVNHVLAVFISTLLSMLVTGAVSWFTFGPDAYISKFEKSFMNRENTVKLIKEESPWIQEKPYIYDLLKEVQSSIKELKTANNGMIRLDTKMDSIIESIKGLNDSNKRIEERLQKVETHTK